ncbi:MAG: hypothetical protein HFG54_12320 [Lachnospiraceae bacterium]|jgi:hypothetical protein|nr:hypothetical protein [Lachnospiraceae bacterium]
MGINFHIHSMTMPDWTGRQYETEPGEYENDKTDLENELRAGEIKFNDLMRDGVTAQLNTIVTKGNREFTNEMLGQPKDRGKSILNVKA